MQNKPDNFSMTDALRLANSPSGKQLIALLQQTGGDDLEQARQAAAKGDYESAKSNLSQILKSPQIQALLKEMEHKNE